VPSIRGIQLRDRVFHTRDVTTGKQFIPLSKDQTVKGIDSNKIYLSTKVRAGFLKDLLEHLRIVEKSGANIETESIRGKGGCPTADPIGPFQHRDS
jgi:hypothetical protein